MFCFLKLDNSKGEKEICCRNYPYPLVLGLWFSFIYSFSQFCFMQSKIYTSEQETHCKLSFQVQCAGFVMTHAIQHADAFQHTV